MISLRFGRKKVDDANNIEKELNHYIKNIFQSNKEKEDEALVTLSKNTKRMVSWGLTL